MEDFGVFELIRILESESNDFQTVLSFPFFQWPNCTGIEYNSIE
jgi:hypothetical protein